MIKLIVIRFSQVFLGLCSLPFLIFTFAYIYLQEKQEKFNEKGATNCLGYYTVSCLMMLLMPFGAIGVWLVMGIATLETNLTKHFNHSNKK